MGGALEGCMMKAAFNHESIFHSSLDHTSFFSGREFSLPIPLVLSLLGAGREVKVLSDLILGSSLSATYLSFG